jgi:hypothetical protein
MNDIISIDGTYYEVIDNSDCNAPDVYIPVQLGPHISWDEHQRMEAYEQLGCWDIPF